MKKTLEQVQKEFGVPMEMGIEQIAKGGSLLPMIIDDKGIVVETISCSSISGGQNEIDNMPKELSLVKLKWIDGELHEFSKRYFAGVDPINELKGIDGADGRLEDKEGIQGTNGPGPHPQGLSEEKLYGPNNDYIFLSDWKTKKSEFRKYLNRKTMEIIIKDLKSNNTIIIPVEELANISRGLLDNYISYKDYTQE